MKLSEFKEDYLDLLNELGYDLSIITNPSFRGILMSYLNDVKFDDEDPYISVDNGVVSIFSRTIDDDCIIQEGIFKLEPKEDSVVITTDKKHPYTKDKRFIGSRIVAQVTLTHEKNEVIKEDIVSSYIFSDPKYYSSEFELSQGFVIIRKDGTVLNRNKKTKETRFVAHRDVENMSSEECLFVPEKIPKITPYMVKSIIYKKK